MACTTIIQGVELDCLDSVGGIKEVYITEFTNVPQANITASSGVITAMSCSSGKKFYTIQLRKQTGQADESIVSDAIAGTQYVDQTVTFPLHKLSAALRYTIKSIAKNRCLVIVKDANDVIKLYGQTTGMDAGEIIASTGKANGDQNGYNVTLKGMEPDQASTLSQAILTTLLS